MARHATMRARPAPRHTRARWRCPSALSSPGTQTGGQWVDITVSTAADVSDELVAALERLLPQLTGHPFTVDSAELAAIVANSDTRLLVARDADGHIVGTATLSTYRTPTRH